MSKIYSRTGYKRDGLERVMLIQSNCFEIAFKRCRMIYIFGTVRDFVECHTEDASHGGQDHKST